jgi:hypothetical protein
MAWQLPKNGLLSIGTIINKGEVYENENLCAAVTVMVERSITSLLRPIVMVDSE